MADLPPEQIVAWVEEEYVVNTCKLTTMHSTWVGTLHMPQAGNYTFTIPTNSTTWSFW